jgi:hypothetical protein
MFVKLLVDHKFIARVEKKDYAVKKQVAPAIAPAITNLVPLVDATEIASAPQIANSPQLVLPVPTDESQINGIAGLSDPSSSTNNPEITALKQELATVRGRCNTLEEEQIRARQEIAELTRNLRDTKDSFRQEILGLKQQICDDNVSDSVARTTFF